MFTGWYARPRHCPQCSFDFEWEEGASLGAMALNIPISGLLFFLLLGGGVALTWPEVPWVGLTAVGVLVIGLFPILFHPIAGNIWVALYILMKRGDRTLGARR